LIFPQNFFSEFFGALSVGNLKKTIVVPSQFFVDYDTKRSFKGFEVQSSRRKRDATNMAGLKKQCFDPFLT